MITHGHKRRLNRAMHELRRPLQALALLDEGDVSGQRDQSRRGLLELVCSALADLDRAVNGGATPGGFRRVSARDLVLGCLERWRLAATESGGFKLYWDAGSAPVEADPTKIAQALDNLIANALEHGGPPLIVTGARVVGRLRITVANGRAGSARGNALAPNGNGSAAGSNGDRPGGSSDPRRGHGTALVSEIASAHRGRFALCCTGDGCVAALELPLADQRYALAA